MSFAEEWANLKNGSVERSSRTQLDSGSGKTGDGLGNGYTSGLVVNQDDLGRVGNDAYALHGKLKRQADIAGMGKNTSGSSATVRSAKELQRSNFDMGEQIDVTLRTWESQVGTLLQACGRISNHLDFTKKKHAQDDEHVAASISDTAKPLTTSKIYHYINGS